MIQTLAYGYPVALVLAAIGQFFLYRAYNRNFHPFKILVEDEIQEQEPQEPNDIELQQMNPQEPEDSPNLTEPEGPKEPKASENVLSSEEKEPMLKESSTDETV